MDLTVCASKLARERFTAVPEIRIKGEMAAGSNMIDLEFLKILGCPLHPERPPFEQKGDYLVCTVAHHGFPVVDGIPHLLPEDVILEERLKELLSGN